jgi:MraZ protein
VFLGEYQTNFSGHGRVVLPKKFRQQLGDETIVLSRGFEGCIWGFALKDFEKEAEKQLQMPVTEKFARDLRRYFFSAAESVKLDDQGRFVIPGDLLEYAGISDEVTIIGAGDHFEIWNPENWRELLKNLTREGDKK